MKKNFSNIKEVRNSIDKIDEEILDLISKRKELVIEAVKQKKRDQIVDQVRIDNIIKKLKQEGDKRGLPSNLVEKLWLTMIQEFIHYEEVIFDEVHKKN
ncbi:chorismate mutase [Rickettsiales bacterium]|nr:chorismate mutase [Rickettsiales bacterium]